MATADLLSAHLDHRRSWDEFFYVYPVISRRSQGVSIGVNLNPDKACNFDCVYCEVDRKTPYRVKLVDLPVLAGELEEMIRIRADGRLFEREPFASAPAAWRRLNDIAFSGDGEPTTCGVFEQAVDLTFRLRNQHEPAAKLVLISDSTMFHRPGVQAGLRRMMEGPYEVWAKLDAGTEEYYRIVNRSRVPFDRVLANIEATAKWCPLYIQSLFLRIHGAPPSEAEIAAYAERVNRITNAGGRIRGLQLYTVARPTPEAWATALSNPELDAIAAQLKDLTGLPQQLSYGNGAA
ncbi:radical SAM protein [Verrucomicrobia bacterium LW23]|nr:radical SAM protein [Verrucomicrobia bacterium LW23]